MSYDAVVFDYDGVLMTPTPLTDLRDAARSAFHRMDVHPEEHEVRKLSIGVDYNWFQGLCDRYGLDEAEFWHARDTAASDHQIDLLERGEKYLYDDASAIHDIDGPRGIVSTNQQRTLDHHLAFTDLADLFGAVYAREPHPDSLWKKKPSPHYLERAMADLDAETALFVGDSTTDVQAAHNADVDSAYIRREHNSDPRVDPTYVIDSLHDLHDILET